MVTSKEIYISRRHHCDAGCCSTALQIVMCSESFNLVFAGGNGTGGLESVEIYGNRDCQYCGDELQGSNTNLVSPFARELVHAVPQGQANAEDKRMPAVVGTTTRDAHIDTVSDISAEHRVGGEVKSNGFGNSKPVGRISAYVDRLSSRSSFGVVQQVCQCGNHSRFSKLSTAVVGL